MSIFEKPPVKSENIVIRVTEKQKTAIAERARDVGVSVSEYILWVCGREIEFNNWLLRKDIYSQLQELHEEVYCQGYDWSYEELCRQVFITGLSVLSETYKPSLED